MPTFRNLLQFAWTLRTGHAVEEGGEVELTDEEAAVVAESPYLELVEAPEAPPEAPKQDPAPDVSDADPEAPEAPAAPDEGESHPTPDELRAQAQALLAEATQEESSK